MKNQLISFLAFGLLAVFVQSTFAADKSQAKKSDKVAAEALRQKATRNVEAITAKLNLTSSQRAKVNVLLSESQWNAALSAFKTARETEIHNQAHNIMKKTIPGMMRKFMPGYMRSKIMASRRKGRRRGPPSGAEIAKIRKNAQSKMQPTMRKTVMPALDKLTKSRLAEMLKDEKTMTRMLADRMVKAGFLGKTATKSFQTALSKAGYSAALTTGGDSTLNDRTKKMLKALNLKAVAKRAGL
jgi:hypothetical protein